MSHLPNREVITIAGLATKTENLPFFGLLSQEIAGLTGNVSHINGAHYDGGKLIASGPTIQLAEANAIIESRPDSEFIILSQSLGAIAALNTVEHNPSANIRIISVSPPLPSPSEMIRHPRLTKRMNIRGGRVEIPSFSFAANDLLAHNIPAATVPVSLPPSYFEDIDEQSVGYKEQTELALNAGNLNIIVPTDDWNTALGTASAGLPNVTKLVGPHSLFTDEAQRIKNIWIIADIIAARK